MTPREGFTLFRSFLNFLCLFQLLSKWRAWRFLARGRASLNLQWISDDISYCETKNDFSKKSWALDHVPVVQIWPTSYRFGRNLSFSRGVDGKKFRYLGCEIVYVRWSSILKKWGGIIVKLSFGGCFTKHLVFGTRKMENSFFVRQKWKLPPATLFVIPRCTCVHNMGTLSQTMSSF